MAGLEDGIEEKKNEKRKDYKPSASASKPMTVLTAQAGMLARSWM